MALVTARIMNCWKNIFLVSLVSLTKDMPYEDLGKINRLKRKTEKKRCAKSGLSRQKTV